MDAFPDIIALMETKLTGMITGVIFPSGYQISDIQMEASAHLVCQSHIRVCSTSMEPHIWSKKFKGKQDMKWSMMRLQQTGLSTQVMEAWLVTQVVEAVLTSTQHGSYSVIFITDGTTSLSTIFMIIDHLRFSGGVGVFEAVANCSDLNNWEEHLSLLVDSVKLLRKLSSYTTIVVISDEATFLAAFVKWSVKGRLMVWSTRLLILTHSRLMELQDLHTTLSNLNSMLVIINDDTANIRCSVYVQLPYSPRGSQVVQVASWTPRRGLLLTSHLPLFPEKFSKFQHKPNLLVAIEHTGYGKLVMVNDPSSGAPRAHFQGSLVKMMEYLSGALNFTYSFVRPPDGVWGLRLSNGSWSGMMGMVVRKEVSIGAGPFMIDRWRAEAVDFTVPMVLDYWRILGVRGLPEVDPWGFLFPLAPLVWATILGMLVMLAAAVFLMYSCGSVKSDDHNSWLEVAFGYVRILLQQDTTLPIYWLWERLLLLVWMMVTLVLTRSYSGNLMALLAVRHIPEPYHTLRDLMDDPSVKLIWEKDSATVPYLRAAKSGIYREIADAENIGRLIFVPRPQFPGLINTLVRRGDHVLINVHGDSKSNIAQDFTRTGKCSFYESKEEFLQIMFAMISQKDSPLVPPINKRMTSMTEAGLFFQWLIAEEPNSTVCDHVPTKITVNEALSVSNLWGMFVILLVGHLTSLSVFSLEILIRLIKQV
ncbi:probable glutamate receptor [Cherax quadricarinatus]|uniref:probable glutamate receptor n=1 Tax=Cherax quadricarinatus TaxID=27406 RepID=UPI00387EE75C